MEHKDHEDRQPATKATFSLGPNVGVVTGKARQRANILAFTIVGIFVLFLVVLLISGVYIF